MVSKRCDPNLESCRNQVIILLINRLELKQWIENRARILESKANSPHDAFSLISLLNVFDYPSKMTSFTPIKSVQWTVGSMNFEKSPILNHLENLVYLWVLNLLLIRIHMIFVSLWKNTKKKIRKQ